MKNTTLTGFLGAWTCETHRVVGSGDREYAAHLEANAGHTCNVILRYSMVRAEPCSKPDPACVSTIALQRLRADITKLRDASSGVFQYALDEILSKRHG